MNKAPITKARLDEDGTAKPLTEIVYKDETRGKGLSDKAVGHSAQNYEYRETLPSNHIHWNHKDELCYVCRLIRMLPQDHNAIDILVLETLGEDVLLDKDVLITYVRRVAPKLMGDEIRKSVGWLVENAFIRPVGVNQGCYELNTGTLGLNRKLVAYYSGEMDDNRVMRDWSDNGNDMRVPPVPKKISWWERVKEAVRVLTGK